MAGNGGNARIFLALELKRIREAKGMTRPGLAKTLFVSESLIRGWETGHRIPTVEHVERLDELYGLAGVLLRIREDLIKASVPQEWFGRWIEIEDRATALWSFEPMVMPGLLQTEDYARATLLAANHQADIEEMVAARMERQRILTREQNPPMFVALIAEAVLRNMVGSPEIMVNQLTRLLEAMEGASNIAVQIIPFTAQACAIFAGPFAIASFDGGIDVAYLDNALSGEVIEDTDQVVRLRRMFDTLRYEALSKPESIALITRELERWKT